MAGSSILVRVSSPPPKPLPHPSPEASQRARWGAASKGIPPEVWRILHKGSARHLPSGRARRPSPRCLGTEGADPGAREFGDEHEHGAHRAWC